MIIAMTTLHVVHVLFLFCGMSYITEKEKKMELHNQFIQQHKTHAYIIIGLRLLLLFCSLPKYKQTHKCIYYTRIALFAFHIYFFFLYVCLCYCITCLHKTLYKSKTNNSSCNILLIITYQPTQKSNFNKKIKK